MANARLFCRGLGARLLKRPSLLFAHTFRNASG